MKKMSLLAIALSVCFVSASLFASGKEEQAKVEEPKVLSIAWWTNQLRTKRTLNVLDMYEKLNPNIKLKPEYTGWGQYWDKLAAQIAANEMPDIIQITDDRFYKFTARNLLSPLDGLPGLNLTGADASAIDLGKINGKLVAIPLGLNAYSMMYDPKLFKEAGVAEPTASWVWDDFESSSLKIHEASGIFGCDIIEVHDLFSIIPREYGKSLFGADGKKLGYEDDKVFSDFFGMMLRLKNADALAGPEYRVENDAELSYTKGKAAILFRWSNLVNLIYVIKKEVGKMTVLPGPNNKLGMYLHPSMFFSVSARCEHKDEAARFLSYWVTDVEATKALEGGRGVPICATGRKALLPTLNPQQQEEFAYVELVAAEYSNPIAADPEAADEVKDILITTYEEIMFGNITPEKAAVKFREQAEAALSR
jgi:multiple sugar transport system substrate-binding protein